MVRLHTGRLYHPGNIPGTYFFWRPNRHQSHSATGRVCQWKIPMTPSWIEQSLNQLHRRVSPPTPNVLRLFWFYFVFQSSWYDRTLKMLLTLLGTHCTGQHWKSKFCLYTYFAMFKTRKRNEFQGSKSIMNFWFPINFRVPMISSGFQKHYTTFQSSKRYDNE